MTINTQEFRSIGRAYAPVSQSLSRAIVEAADALDVQTAEIAKAHSQVERWKKVAESAEDRAQVAADEIDRLQRIIDSRPAINAGLPQTYIDWSQSIYLMEATRTLETPQ